jgi:hypothetical protein
MISFSETRRSRKGSNQVSREAGDHSHAFSCQKLLHWQSRLSQCTVMVNQPILVPLLFLTFLADLLPQTYQNLLVAMLVNHLAWRNKFLINNTLAVKKDNQQSSWCSTWLAQIQKSVLRTALSLKAVFSTSCTSDTVFLSMKQNLTQMCCSFKSAIRKLWITLNTHNNTHPLTRNAEGYGGKTH